MTISKRICHYSVVIVGKIDSEQLWKATSNLRKPVQISYRSTECAHVWSLFSVLDWTNFKMVHTIAVGHLIVTLTLFAKQTNHSSKEKRKKHGLLIFIKDYYLLYNNKCFIWFVWKSLAACHSQVNAYSRLNRKKRLGHWLNQIWVVRVSAHVLCMLLNIQKNMLNCL